MGKIDESFVKELREDFLSSPKNLLALNVCTRYDPAEAAVQRSELCSTTAHHVFTNKVEAEGKPVSNQRSSGRCWIFAVLNVARLPFCKKYTLDDFEFSQAYLFFWDKIERCNFFLHKIVELLRKGEKPSGRLLSFLLDSPQGDAGQWDMVVDIVNKYGLVPKKVFPESFSCEKSVVLNGFLNGKLKEFAKDLDILVEKGESDADAHVKIRDQMKVVYRIVSICLGVPPTSFDWEYVDKEKQHHRISGITPLEFYNQYVKPLFNVDDKMCIVNDPRKTSGFGRPLLVEHLGNVVGGRETVYNNQEIEVLMRGVRDSIRANEAVWFGCHVSTYFFRKNGILSTKIRDFKLLFDEDYSLSMSKADRLIYGQSQMTHAMVFTGISCGEGDQLPTKFRVENSWGEDCGEKGYLVMTDDWFREFVYEVVVDKKFLSKEVLDAFDGARVVLPPWDPMGALAN